MPTDPFPPSRRAWLRRRLLAWFAGHARDLPWRADRDAYRIWVSEVMLQQTQVATVIPYFQRFLTQFPDLAALAGAEEADVLRQWQGLGYYRRARDLHAAARLLVARGHATVPDDAALLSSLPGFGRYTVNAVLSQAYERKLPILEANSQRVLCRLLAVEDDPRESATQKELWRAAEELLPTREFGAFNQALMELGALVCTPAAPRCGECPLRLHCRARLQNRQDEIPRRGKPAQVVAVEEVALVVRRGERVLLVQRPDEGRWARMWECPHLPLEWMETHAAGARRLLAELGVEAEVVREVATIRHGVTRFRITMTALEARYRAGSVRREAFAESAWVRLEDLHEYPLSTPQRRLLARYAAA